MTDSKLHALPSDVATVQALAQAGHLQKATRFAAQSAEFMLDAIREAHKTSCAAGGPMELLLREAIADAARLHDRLVLIESFAAGEI